jgi:NAD dependent epimerase/dehydratase family enzyme
MADEMLLSGANVRPARLQAAGFAFDYPDLERALRHELGESG